MKSLIPGYEYDIFISYRQKDNKHDGWISEFVNNLKGELESTFKEEISLYFDINPHDGLLETHDVDASLQDKLKCLIFIPIISRTYCDPKSFAWEHEFKAFIELASKDQFGLKVKLPNGNVASRMLPIRIHDLDEADIKEYESVLGGVLRGIEFIYKETGIDKPLVAADDEKKNLNNTKYRIQIIKVTHAIKEIIQGMKPEPIHVEKKKILHREPQEEVKKEEKIDILVKSLKLPKWKILSGVIITTILVIAAILAYPKIFKRNTLERLRSSGERITVAVMPFRNMTNDTIWNIWQDGVQNELINSLTNSEELKVRQTESITSIIQSERITNYALITPSVARTISQKLGANIFIYGSIKQVGKTIRVNAQLIDSKTEDTFKSFQIDGTVDNILHITDSLSRQIRNFIIISVLEKKAPPDIQKFASTYSPEAYKYFVYADKFYLKGDYTSAIIFFSQAIAIDSNFLMAALWLSNAYYFMGLTDQGNKWLTYAYNKRDQMSLLQNLFTSYRYYSAFASPSDCIKSLERLLEVDDQVPLIHFQLGYQYFVLLQYEKAIHELERAIELYHKYGSKPRWSSTYTCLGEAYHKTGQYKKEKEAYEKSEQDFPDDPDVLQRQAILALTERDTVAANRYIQKNISVRKKNSWTEGQITLMLATIYSEAGFLNKAEAYYRGALFLDSNSWTKYSLARFLIEKDRKINEGMELIDKVLTESPDNGTYWDCKGRGLYKQGRYEEALKALEKAFETDKSSTVYLHIEEVKKAVSEQKN